MKTLIYENTDEIILAKAADVIKNGGLVAFPTETVYGLGANALMEDAAKKVYAAKGRPSDNPLIIHLADPNDADRYCYTSDAFRKIAELFMPGPITVIMPKKDIIPSGVTGGLDTVAVRVPSNPIAHRLIELAGCPIAAPSANISGRPSCTAFSHVVEDMNGKIDMIIGGGNSEIGLESTIVSIDGGQLKLLRPGRITKEMLEDAGFSVTLDKAVTEKLSDGEKPLAPGMKYRHYAPRADVILLSGRDSDVESYMLTFADDDSVAYICYDEYLNVKKLKNAVILGKELDLEAQARRVFDILREFDKMPNIKTVLTKLPSKDGIGLAIYNRLLKAAGYRVVTL